MINLQPLESSSHSLPYSSLSPSIQGFLNRYGFGEECALALAGIAGSRRAYYRIRQGLRSFIILMSPPDDADFGRFLRITQFYRLLDFPVPRVYCIDDPSHQVVLEDLGDERLYDSHFSHRGDSLIQYRRVVDTLIDLQTRCFQRHQECPDIHSRIFGQSELLWESNYYHAQYLKGFPESDPENDVERGKVFLELAERVDKQSKSIMHRDFQSQNIMIQNGENIRIIDFQGSRLGSVYYDLASLLLDPYVMLPDADIGELLRYYHAAALVQLPFEDMEQEFLLAGSQRVMQALGAYCFLSRHKGLPQFEQYIAPGEKRLRWVVEQSGWKQLKIILPSK